MKHIINEETGMGMYSYYKHKFYYIIGDEAGRLEAHRKCIAVKELYPNVKNRTHKHKGEILNNSWWEEHPSDRQHQD